LDDEAMEEVEGKSLDGELQQHC